MIFLGILHIFWLNGWISQRFSPGIRLQDDEAEADEADDAESDEVGSLIFMGNSGKHNGQWIYFMGYTIYCNGYYIQLCINVYVYI